MGLGKKLQTRGKALDFLELVFFSKKKSISVSSELFWTPNSRRTIIDLPPSIPSFSFGPREKRRARRERRKRCAVVEKRTRGACLEIRGGGSNFSFSSFRFEKTTKTRKKNGDRGHLSCSFYYVLVFPLKNLTLKRTEPS